MARSWSASKRDKIITVQFLDINPEKGKEMEKKKDKWENIEKDTNESW